jgi:hypothetical protein
MSIYNRNPRYVQGDDWVSDIPNTNFSNYGNAFRYDPSIGNYVLRNAPAIMPYSPQSIVPTSPVVRGATGSATSAGAAASLKPSFIHKAKYAGEKGLNSLKNWWRANVTPNFGWNKDTGLKMFGKDLGGWTGAGTLGVGAIQGAQALGTLNQLEDAGKSTEELLNDIVISANSNPIVNSYLTSDQKSLLRKAKKGDISTGETSLGDLVPNDLNDVLNIGKGVLMGIPGGVPGMIVGGVGSALNSGLEGNLQDTNLQNAELEALLQALEDAEMQYQSMRRPNFTGLGIQQRYQNMYM